MAATIPNSRPPETTTSSTTRHPFAPLLTYCTPETDLGSFTFNAVGVRLFSENANNADKLTTFNNWATCGRSPRRRAAGTRSDAPQDPHTHVGHTTTPQQTDYLVGIRNFFERAAPTLSSASPIPLPPCPDLTRSPSVPAAPPPSRHAGGHEEGRPSKSQHPNEAVGTPNTLYNVVSSGIRHEPPSRWGRAPVCTTHAGFVYCTQEVGHAKGMYRGCFYHKNAANKTCCSSSYVPTPTPAQECGEYNDSSRQHPSHLPGENHHGN